MKDKLPTGWDWKKLGDVCSLITKGTTPTTHGFSFQKNGVNFIKIENIEDEVIQHKTINQFISNEANDYIRRSKLKENDILFSIAGTIGKIAIVKEKDLPANTNQALAIIRGYDEFCIDKFLLNILKSSFLFETLKKARGGALQNISLNDISNCYIPLPPIEEQKKIVTFLESSFTKLDKAIVLVKQNIEKIKQLNESALSEVFEKLLSDKVIRKKLVDIADVKRGKSKHRPRNDKRLYDGDYPLIQTGDIRNAGKFITQFSQTYNETGLAQSKLWEKGTVCLTIAANIGDVAILGIDACFPDSAVGIHSKTEDNIYIYYFLKSIKKQLDEKSSASAQKNLSVEKLSDFYIPIPSLAKQQQIVSHLDQLTENNKKLLQHYQNKLQALQRLKNSVLESAFKGEFKKEQKAKTFNLAFYQMQLIGLSIEANKYDNIPQGEMAIAKDMYLLDRLFQVPTKMNFANHNLGPFAPEIKKGITNKTYFGRKNFPNSQATYVVTQNEAELFKTVSADLKSQVFNGINELNSKLFSKVSPYKRAEAKELFATVLKCIEDTQSTELSTIREAMRKWKIEIGQFKTKADKFTEPNTQLVIKFIVKENWHLKVLGK